MFPRPSRLLGWFALLGAIGAQSIAQLPSDEVRRAADLNVVGDVGSRAWSKMLPIFTFIAAGLVFLWLYSQMVAQKPRVYVKFGSELYCRAHRHLRLIKHAYRPAWWAPNGTIMTVARQLFRSCPQLPFSREIIEFPDGGCTSIDWLTPKTCNDSTHIVVYLPGITGSTHDCAYILHAAREACEKGWRVVVVNPRGLGGIKLKTSRTYNAANPHDISYILEHVVHKRYPNAKKLGCGFSMGGMILWNYLATRNKDNAFLDSGMIISSPFDPQASTQSLEQPFPKLVFNRHLAQCLVNIVEPYKHMFEHLVDWHTVTKVKTIREFDHHFTARVFGYNDGNHYYEDATLATKVHRIPIPTVVLTAIDDYFAPFESLPLDKISESENVICLVTAHGGHTAYMEKANPDARGYVERLLVQWGDMIFNEKY